MNKKLFSSCLKKRDYLNKKVFDQQECIKYGEWFESQEFLNDAIDFYVKVNAKEHLKRLLPKVIDEGDVFLFKKIFQALKEQPKEEMWKEIGENALKLGKWAFALKAFQAIKDEEKIKKVEDVMQAQGFYFTPEVKLPFLNPQEKKRKK